MSIGQDSPPHTLAELRHHLRTPLNHIVGYSEMLLEEFKPEDVGEIPVRLRNICAAAHALLTSLNTAAERACSPEPHLHSLRTGMLPFLYEISQNVGELLRETAENMTLDLLRIGSATAELMAFAQDPTAAKHLRASMRMDQASGQNIPGTAPVLVVDDDEANRDLLLRQLQRLGYSVVCAASGPEALSQLKSRRFEVALVDFMMPGMDGLEVLERIKGDPVTYDVPVIIISALDEISGVTRCIEQGAEDYLFKSFDPVLLSARIKAAIERTRLRLSQRERTEELERFAYMASHDLQAPLRTITAYLQLNGLGIPPEHLKDIFNVFQRLHGGDRPGTGLGLSICKRIMERLGGQIWVESQQGIGSTFHFTIPDVAHGTAYHGGVEPAASLSSESSSA